MSAKDQRGELFVGRERPRRRLLTVLGDALAGRMRLAMVSGEAGIGKTALVAVVTGDASDRAAVCWGTCWHGAGAPGYWPWTQASTRSPPLWARTSPSSWPARTGTCWRPSSPPSARLPTPVTRGPSCCSTPRRAGSRRPRSGGPPWWCSTISIGRTSRRWPCWTSSPARGWRRPSWSSGRTATTSSSLRHGTCWWASRPEASTSPWRAWTSRTWRPSWQASPGRSTLRAAEIHRRTGGHPFLVREMAHLLDTAGDAAGVPSVVRDAIEQRLTQLPGRARAVLDAAAVAGNELAADVLADALDMDVDEVDERIGRALRAGVLKSTPAATPRFTHDLLRETLYSALAPSTRVALHRRIAVALENRADQGGSVTAAEVAYHYACSASAGSADGVVTWALAAAEADRTRLAFAEAAGYLTRARLALTQAGIVLPEPARVDLLVAEAEALARRAIPTAPGSCWCGREATPTPAGIRPGSGPSPSGCIVWGLGLRCGAMT